jgi:hypothetical protein
VKPIEEACRDRNHIALFIAKIETIGVVVASGDSGEPRSHQGAKQRRDPLTPTGD